MNFPHCFRTFCLSSTTSLFPPSILCDSMNLLADISLCHLLYTCGTAISSYLPSWIYEQVSMEMVSMAPSWPGYLPVGILYQCSAIYSRAAQWLGSCVNVQMTLSHLSIRYHCDADVTQPWLPVKETHLKTHLINACLSPLMHTQDGGRRISHCLPHAH